MAFVFALSSTAHAAPSSRLVYSRGEGGEECPDESALRRAVASRVGYDPFFPWAPVTVIAELRRASGKLRGRVTLVDAAGLQRGVRELETDADCAELVSSVALAIAIALDTMDAQSQPAAPAPAPTPEPERRPEPPKPTPEPERALPPEPEPPPAALLRAFATLGGHGALLTAPSLAGGATVGAGVRFRSLGLGLEGRYDFPASRGVVSAQLATIALIPCLHVGVFLGCARASVGEVIGEGTDIAASRTRAAPYAAIGVRAGAEIPVLGPLEVRAHVDLDLAFTKTTLEVDSGPVWTSPPVGGAAGLAALVRFP